MKTVNLKDIPDDVRASIDVMGIKDLNHSHLDTATFLSLYHVRMNNLEGSVSEGHITGDAERHYLFIEKFRRAITIIGQLKPVTVDFIYLQSHQNINFIIIGADGVFIEMIRSLK